MIKDFLRFGLGVSQLIIAIIALQTLCICFFVIFLHRGLITVVQGGLLDLDNKIAGAIQNLINGELNLPDPPNPIQAMMIEMMMSKMKNTTKAEVLVKDNQGKFA